MRYIIVNERVPRERNATCCMCPSVPTYGYVREIDTRLLYCCVECYDEHVASAIEFMARRVS